MGTLSDIEADWPRISALLDEAMSRAAAEREAFIDALTAPDDRFRDTLRELLALQAKAETEDFMEALPVIPGLLTGPWPHEAGAGTGGTAGALAPGTEVGPYRLLRPIGEGGMGAVWLAERADGTLKRKVALKLPRLAWASDLAARMARERDILSALEHPNIARLYDAGVDAVGRPWLAIEYVEGRDLAAFCDTARLDPRARVRIFLQVLSAVQYAHGSLVIHRDLKPANILVTPQGEVRLLDFGIARLEEGAADAGPALTREGVNAMTPRYASPEQVQGKRLTVASDIYSLGVVLHELLTGETPYTLRRGTRAEYEQAIVESDLRVPSRTTVSAEAAAARSSTPQTLTRMLRGDGDAMLMRALAPAPEGRYASAAALRDDLERWLEGRPVSAVPPSRTYALRKFVARNRLAVAASAAAALALVAVSVVAVLQAQRAERSAAEARAEAGRSEATKDLIFAVIRDADAAGYAGSASGSVRDIVTRQLDVRLAEQPRLREEILDQLWEVYAKEGDLAGAGAASARISSAALSRGDMDQAVEALISEGYYAISQDDFDRTRQKLDEIRAVTDPALLRPRERAAVHDLEGQWSESIGDRAEASRHFDRKIEAAREARDDGTVFTGLVDRIRVDGLRDDAVDRGRKLADVRDRLALLPEPERPQSRLLLAATLLRIGDYREGWSDILRLMASDAALFGNTNYLSRRAHEVWLQYCVVVGRPGLARQWLREFERPALSHVLRNFERDPVWRLRVAEVLASSGDLVAARRQLDSARDQIGSRFVTMSSSERRVREDLVLAEATLDVRTGLDKRTTADISALLTSLRDPSDSASGESHRWAWLRGLVEMGRGRGGEAVRELAEASRRARAELGSAHPDVARIDIALAVAQNRTSLEAPSRDAIVAWREADSMLRAVLPSPHPLLDYLDGLGGPARNDADARRMASLAASRPLPGPIFP
jgi:hypothetical protein